MQGFLTAWKVNARSLHLEESARAHVVLQETERLEIGRDARLVGNFSSERELVGLFSRFANQVRSLPFLFDKKAPAPRAARSAQAGGEDRPRRPIPARHRPSPHPPSSPSRSSSPSSSWSANPNANPPRRLPARAGRADEAAPGAGSGDPELTYKTLFGRIAEPREDAQQAQELVRQHFTGEVVVG